MGSHDPAMAAAIEEKMKLLRVRYVDTLKQRMQVVERAFGLLVGGEFQAAEDRAELQSEAHKLSGTGSTYGFPQISAAAKALELKLIDGIAGDDPELLVMVADLMNVCHEAVASVVSAPALQPSTSADGVAVVATPAVAAPVVADDKDDVIEVPLPVLLVLDDDESVLQVMTDLFSNDAQIVTGRSAVEALDLIRKYKPDLVLLDNMMPGGVSGLSLLENLQSMDEFKDLPVIMISGSGQPEEVMRGLMAGAVDYVTKPFDAADMATKVRKRLWRLQSVILVADDDESVRDIMSHKLRSAGCTVVCANDGAQAWEMLTTQAFALVVLDMMMPGYDGMTLLRMMKDEPRLAGVPVIFLTARHMSADVLEGLNTGAADYITKPFNPDEVVSRCTRFLNHPVSSKGR